MVVLLLAGPATNVTAAVAVALPEVTVTVLISAVVETMVAEKTPVSSVVPDAGVMVLLLPVADNAMGWNGTPLPYASRTVAVKTVELEPLAVTVVGDTASDVMDDEAAPLTNVTSALIVPLPKVAMTILSSAVVDASVVVY